VFFRQFFTPLTFRYKFNPRNLSVVTPKKNVTNQQQRIDDEIRENSQNGSKGTLSGRSGLIASLQTDLAHLGFDPGPVDGYFGRRTEAAIRNFQRQRGLPVDGEPSKTLLQQVIDYKDRKEHSETTTFGAEPGVSSSSISNSPTEPTNSRLSKRVYEDYEYIDPSIPKVYEDYEYIDQ
jgi:peptidoglycan hydrolase-like protein with peptidoglycan-binding domain